MKNDEILNELKLIRLRLDQLESNFVRTVHNPFSDPILSSLYKDMIIEQSKYSRLPLNKAK